MKRCCAAIRSCVCCGMPNAPRTRCSPIACAGLTSVGAVAFVVGTRLRVARSELCRSSMLSAVALQRRRARRSCRLRPANRGTAPNWDRSSPPLRSRQTAIASSQRRASSPFERVRPACASHATELRARWTLSREYRGEGRISSPRNNTFIVCRTNGGEPLHVDLDSLSSDSTRF